MRGAERLGAGGWDGVRAAGVVKGRWCVRAMVKRGEGGLVRLREDIRRIFLGEEERVEVKGKGGKGEARRVEGGKRAGSLVSSRRDQQWPGDWQVKYSSGLW